jgi:hypothetical protein
LTGATGDAVALDIFDFNLPEGSRVNADSAFTIYAVEDLLKEAAELDLRPERKKNSNRPRARRPRLPSEHRVQDRRDGRLDALGLVAQEHSSCYFTWLRVDDHAFRSGS